MCHEHRNSEHCCRQWKSNEWKKNNIATDPKEENISVWARYICLGGGEF